MNSFEDQEELTKNYITISYADKDKAKKAGAKWDIIKKSWYIYEDYSLFLLKTGINLNYKKEKFYIDVDYEDKDKAKKLGAKFDILKKSWYIYDNLETFLNDFNVEKEIDKLEKQVKGLYLSLALNKNVDMTKSNQIYEDKINKEIKEIEERIIEKRIELIK